VNPKLKPQENRCAACLEGGKYLLCFTCCGNFAHQLCWNKSIEEVVGKLRSDKVRCWYCRNKPASLESIREARERKRKRDQKKQEKEEEKEVIKASQDSFIKSLDLPSKKISVGHGGHRKKMCPLGCGYRADSCNVNKHAKKWCPKLKEQLVGQKRRAK
jgi:hypothetical protein